jgi:hypothetical protein
MLGLLMLAGGLAGCGRDTPIDFHRAVSPCLELPKTMGFDGASELVKILTTDFKNKDANGDGSLTLAEAQATTGKPNLIDDNLFAALNPKDGKLTTADLKKGSSTLYKWAGFYKVKLLKRFDRNMDNFVTFDEVKGYLNIDQAAFDEADKPDEGAPNKKLDADEFLGLVLHQNALDCGSTEEADTTAASLQRRSPYPPAAYPQTANRQTGYAQAAYPQAGYPQTTYQQTTNRQAPAPYRRY